MNLLLSDLKKLPKLYLGFIILALGNAMVKQADLGMNPWGVFHDGISILTGITFGTVIMLVGIIIIIFSWIFKLSIPGLGTILNMLTIGPFVNIIIDVFGLPIPELLILKWVMFIVGSLSFSFGVALYISTELGSGPRDGLFVAFNRMLNIPISLIKPFIEFIVLIIGFFLGGKFGYGTIIGILIGGKLVSVYFKMLKYDSKTRTVRTINDYIKVRS